MERKIIEKVLFIGVLSVLFGNWLFASEIIGGDWPYFFQEAINNFSFLPPAWSPSGGNGLGGTFIVYALDSYLYFTGWLFSNIFHIPWPFVYKFFYFGMFLFLGTFSVWYLLKKLLPQIPQQYRFLGIFIYVANTYILLLTSGGQMGIALAYSMAPLVLAMFINVANCRKSSSYKVIKLSIITGVLFAVQVMFDVRIAYVMLAAVGLFVVIKLSGYKVIKGNFLKSLVLILMSIVIPLGITGLLHAFWILPFLLAGNSSIDQLGGIYTTAGAVKFFSFAKLENAIGLLHPNWPENIFGKIYFMRWEFLILPLLAFSSLLFVSTKALKKAEPYAELSRKKLAPSPYNLSPHILFFALLGLVGAFLAKGANEPFGQLYVWLFGHVPGFVMFRDPTKWYVLVAISFAVLVPFSSWRIYVLLSKFTKFSIFNLKFSVKSKIFNLQNVFVLLLASCFLLLIQPALIGQLGGTFKSREVPIEYIALKDKLYNDNEFYRTLWVPRQQRFTFGSASHPSMEAGPLFAATSAAEFARSLKASKGENYLSDLGVKYIIIPYDPYGEIFIDNRKYSQKKRDVYEKVLDKVAWLKKVQDGRITMYETRQHKDLFYLLNCELRVENCKLEYKVISSTQYEVSVKNVKKGDTLVFSQNYSIYWEGTVSHQIIKSSSHQAARSRLNSFVLPLDGSYVISVYYSVEKYYIIGRVISIVALIIIIFLLVRFKK